MQPSRGPVPASFAAACAFFEKYVLSLVYLYLAWREYENAYFRPLADVWGPSFDRLAVARSVQQLIVVLLQLSIGGALLLSRPPLQPPRYWRDILVPLAAAFFFLTYQLMPYLPAVWTWPFWLSGPPKPVAFLALGLALVGPAISLWGAMALGRSFGILVSVRKIVGHGPYQYVRHPIYLGYFLLWTALCLGNCSWATVVMLLVSLALLSYRAHLEEMRLAESSAEYREYRQRTGFLFPRLFARTKATAGFEREKFR
jgi:protein-S-isoprenylcysteine O-methyltransferase Ste14